MSSATQRRAGTDGATRRLSRRESQARTRRRLLDAAAVAFREQGFHRASAEAIAAAAGYTRGAVYANFGGKDGLFLALLDEEMETRWAGLGPSPDPATLAARYREMLDADRPWTLALLEFSLHAARHPELAAELRARNYGLRARVAERLTEADPALGRADAEAAARLIVAVNSGVSLERALDPAAAGEAELARAYAAVLAV